MQLRTRCWAAFVLPVWASLADAQCIDYSSWGHWVRALDMPGSARRVVTAGSHGFVADGECGLVLLDISTPASPRIVGRVDTPGDATGVAVAGDHAYVADGPTSGLQVINVSDPQSPRIVRARRCEAAWDLLGRACWDLCEPAAFRRLCPPPRGFTLHDT